MSEPVENCENCAFGRHRGLFTGHCRRHAPQPILTQYGLKSMWPPVNGDDICGDFELRDAE